MKEPDIYIFYHLYTLPGWEDLWRFHFKMMRKSKLFRKCKEVRLCVVAHHQRDKELVKKEVEPFSKIKIHSMRFFGDIPTLLWKNPHIMSHTQLGEGESILKMIDFSLRKKNDIYLFLHSKSITVPKAEKRRSQMKRFYALGLKKKCPPKQRSIFIRNQMTSDVIGRWEEKVQRLRTKNFYYGVWNFFWANGSFLRKFNFKKFNSQGSLPRHYTLKNRHWSAVFPVTLNQVINKKPSTSLKEIRKSFKQYY